jgi:AbrB family transcriptional regulator, transcriptional pleiotropic regulator of transition state genes
VPRRPDRDEESLGARGVARRVDDLGRIVIPKEVRRAFAIAEGDLVDITIEGDAIALRRLASRCALCDGTEDLGLFRTRLVCTGCVTALRAPAEASASPASPSSPSSP